MALNLGSLVQTASGALNKKRELEQEAAERKRQQEMDVLQRSLMQARIDDLHRPDTPTARNIDPLSQEGIAATVERARQMQPFQQANQPKPPKPPDAGQRRAGALTLVAEQAFNILEGAPPPSPADVAAERIPFGVGNYWLSEDRKKQVAAGSQLVSHYLYAISGATVTPQEAERQAQAILPQPKDGPEVLAQKAAQRRTMIAAIRQMAGDAAPPSVIGSQTQTSQAPGAPAGEWDDFLQ